MAETETLVAPAPAPAQVSTATPPNAFLAALKKELRPKDTATEARIEAAVDALSKQALQSTSLISTDVVKTIQAIIAQLVQAKAQEVVTGLRDAAKIEVIDPELKKSMETPKGLPGDLPDDLSGGADGNN